MKKIISVLLAALLLCGGISVAASAAPAAALEPQAITLPGGTAGIPNFLWNLNFANLNDVQLLLLINTLKGLKAAGVDYSGFLESVRSVLPIGVKAELHKQGLASYPVWERNSFANFIFKWLLFGFVWM